MDLDALRSQLAELRDELDGLQVGIQPLRDELGDLRSGQREMASIKSRIRGLLHRDPAGDTSRTAPRYQRFHDS